MPEYRRASNPVRISPTQGCREQARLSAFQTVGTPRVIQWINIRDCDISADAGIQQTPKMMRAAETPPQALKVTELLCSADAIWDHLCAIHIIGCCLGLPVGTPQGDSASCRGFYTPSGCRQGGGGGGRIRLGVELP